MACDPPLCPATRRQMTASAVSRSGRHSAERPGHWARSWHAWRTGTPARLAARMQATAANRAYCQKSSACHQATSSSRSDSVPPWRAAAASTAYWSLVFCRPNRQRGGGTPRRGDRGCQVRVWLCRCSAYLPCALDHPGEQVLYRCAVATARIGQAGSMPRTPALRVAFSVMSAAVLSVSLVCRSALMRAWSTWRPAGHAPTVGGRCGQAVRPLVTRAGEEERG